MQIALKDLNLDSLTIIYPGKDQFLLFKNKTMKVIAIGLEKYIS